MIQIIYICPGSPADESKMLHEGDTLMSIDGHSVSGLPYKVPNYDPLSCLPLPPSVVSFHLVAWLNLFVAGAQGFVHRTGVLECRAEAEKKRRG